MSAYLLTPWGERANLTTFARVRTLLASKLARARGPEPKLCGATTVRYGLGCAPEQNIIVCLHVTDIVKFLPDGSAVLDWAGWHTVTTNDRMTGVLPLGYGVSGLAQIVVRTPLGLHACPLGVRVRIGARGAVTWESRAGRWVKAQRFTLDEWRRAEYAAKKLPYGGED